jgi:hypothetical protein
MKKSALLAAAAVLVSAFAAPASAQQVVYNPGYCAQFYPNANCQNLGPGSPYESSFTGQTYQERAYQDRNGRNSNARWGDNDGFWPADAAAGVIGGAVGTAAAIATAPAAVATAPIGGDAYARRNGFVCIPGSVFRGEDGRRHLCQ